MLKTFLSGLNPNMERGILVVNSLDTHSQFNKTLLSMQNEKKRTYKAAAATIWSIKIVRYRI